MSPFGKSKQKRMPHVWHLRPEPSKSRQVLANQVRVWAPVALISLGLLSGCKPVGPDYKRPVYNTPAIYKETGASNVTVPPPEDPKGGSWTTASPSDGMLRGKWWEIYNDPQLNALEERIATYNQSVHQAYETYLAAREQVKQARAAYYPTLSAGPGFEHDSLSRRRPLTNDLAKSPNQYNALTLEGQASWEPDLWGRIRRTVEGSVAAAQADAADMANTSLSLESEMAEDYFELRGLDTQAQLLESNIKDLTASYDLTRRRLAGGIGTEADAAQAKTLLDSTRAQLIDVGVARAQYEHAVGSIADYKLPTFSIARNPLDGNLPTIPLGVPSQLLQRRPDIAAAERRAAQANAQIGIAVSAFYPTISLSGAGGFESTHAGTWIQGPAALWSLGAQATELLIDGGRRKAVTNQYRDLFEASASNYRGVVFLAFNEVEDKLSNLRILEQEKAAQREAVASAQHSLEISTQRYKGGVTSYLEVLTAETTLIANERTEADLKSRQFAASVELIRALGGGWDASQIPK